MSTTCFFILSLIVTSQPLIVDSLIYSVDIEKMEVKEQVVSGTILDYCIDDFLYVLTDQALYKIDCPFLTVEDRIPLFQRFNYLTLNDEDIILITTNEIIIIDKHNLAFKQGIGIERGDYRPITTLRRIFTSDRDYIIYLIADSGRKSILKIFDINTGRLKRKIRVDRVIFFDYSHEDNSFITLDINRRITVYDMYLKKKESVKLKCEGKRFKRAQHGYIVYGPEAIFFVNQNGEIIDFQPIAMEEKSIGNTFTLFTKKGIVFLDSLTLRAKGLLQNVQRIKGLQMIQSPHTDYAIILDTHYHLHAIDIITMEIQSLIKKKAAIKEVVPPVSSRTDSLWYFQFGAFTHYDNAVEMHTNIKSSNIPVFIESTDLYRVKFGGFQDKMTAIEIINKIDLNGWFVFHEKIEQEDTVQFSVDTESYILKDGIIKKE